MKRSSWLATLMAVSFSALWMAGPGAQQAPRGGSGVTYDPPRVEDAPSQIREAVTYGHEILQHTGKALPDHVGNQLACSNCHFEAGRTKGGKKGGLSLVGVGAAYPKYKERSEYATDLVTKVNNCLMRSENGKPLQAGSKEMAAVLTYLQWISKGIPVYADVEWLGLKPIDSQHRPDAGAGRQVFQEVCARCHGENGQGKDGPPLWGDASFNDGASMSEQPTLSAFAYLNMPKGNPTLTEEQALDVGAFVTSQPRPSFESK